jgi:hypothetical protein
MQLSVYGPFRGGLAAARSFWSGVAHRLSAVRPGGEGTVVYEREWDLLILLDACRVDALAAVADEYEFLPEEVPWVRSVAPTSSVWLTETFAPAYADEVARTQYVTANAHVDGFDTDRYAVDPGSFRTLRRVYDNGFDEELGTIPPRAVTDAAVDCFRETPPERGIVHYMQPHTPYRGLNLDGIGVSGGKAFRETVWDRIAAGYLSRSEAWEYYLDNLRWVLDDVALLVENVDADRVVVSADHGEAYGEWGAYGHSDHGEFAGLRRVPWVELSATDAETHEPTTVSEPEATPDVEDQLEHLGYR